MGIVIEARRVQHMNVELEPRDFRLAISSPENLSKFTTEELKTMIEMLHGELNARENT
jgi:hypothetical protein